MEEKTDKYKKVYEIIYLVHLWQSDELTWKQVIELGKFNKTVIKRIRKITKKDNEPTLVRKLLTCVE